MPTVRTAEIISVGTELLLGEITDTNSAYLAADLARLGVDVLWSSRVGDNEGRIAQLLELALGRSDLVVVGGGLGPTDDDLTREAVARVLGEEQARDPELEQWLRERFSSSGRTMPERNLQQTNVIPSATVLPNPIGTAPGWLVRTTRAGAERVIVTLPGPPREMQRMWREQAIVRLDLPTSRLYTRTYKTHGVGESHVAERLGALTRQANPSVATYAKRDGVHVRVAAKADDMDLARALATPTIASVTDAIGPATWGFDGDELPDLVLKAMRSRGWRLALAEGFSGGLLTELLEQALDADERSELRPGTGEGSVERVPASLGAHGLGQRTLAGSVIAWQPETMKTLGPTMDLLRRLPTGLPAGAAELVAAIAAAVRALFAADVGLAVGYPQSVSLPIAGDDAAVGTARGDAGPNEAVNTRVHGGGQITAHGNANTPDQRYTRLVIALATDEGTTVETLSLPPLGRAWLRERSAFTGLNLLLRSALR
jgi:nicotinamide-nucleotide amidase